MDEALGLQSWGESRDHGRSQVPTGQCVGALQPEE